MAIRTNIGTGPIDVTAADTTIFQQPAGIDRYQVVGFNVHNPTAATITITVYISPDLTSAAGDQVAVLGIPPNDGLDVNEIIGQGYGNLNVIAVGSSTGLKASLTRTEYSGGD